MPEGFLVLLSVRQSQRNRDVSSSPTQRVTARQRLCAKHHKTQELTPGRNPDLDSCIRTLIVSNGWHVNWIQKRVREDVPEWYTCRRLTASAIPAIPPAVMWVANPTFGLLASERDMLNDGKRKQMKRPEGYISRRGRALTYVIFDRTRK